MNHPSLAWPEVYHFVNVAKVQATFRLPSGDFLPKKRTVNVETIIESLGSQSCSVIPSFPASVCNPEN